MRFAEGNARLLLQQIENYIATELNLSAPNLYLDQMTNLNFSRE